MKVKGIAVGGALLVLMVPAVAEAARPSPLVAKVNDLRRAHGLPSLRQSPSLTRSSSRYANHMIRANRFGHASRIWASSRFRRLGEVLGLTRGWRVRRARVVRKWRRSPLHRALLLGRSFRYVGAGRARGRIGGRRVTVWVVQLGNR